MSWRINVSEDDRSRTVKPNNDIIGAMVIKSSKGKVKPTLISTGEEARIIDLFGYPNSDFPNVWEAIQYNKEAPLRISAPYASDARYGGILVTQAGSVPLSVGLDDPSNLDLEAVECTQIIGTGDGVEDNFTATLNMIPYVNQSLDIQVNGVSLANLALTDAEPEVISADELSAGTLTRATGALDITFTAAPANGAVITITWQANKSLDTYFTLFTASPHEENEGVIVTYDTATSYFTINHYIQNNKSVYKLINSYIVSITPGTFDGFGSNIYIEDILNVDHDYLIAVDNALAYTAFVSDTSRVNFGGGERGAAITATELTTGWGYFQKANTYPCNIFMDLSADPAIPDIFNTLRNSYQRYQTYILPLPMANDVSTAISTKSGYSLNNRGLCFYWNWGKVRNTYYNNSMWTPLIGKVGVKHAQMRNVYFGLAPSWIDENSHGGQLGSGIIELYHDPSETELELLDNAGINPIIFHPTYGVMIVSQRTAQSPGTLSDSSWIGHSRCFDYIIKNIIDQVLTFQITKLNDEAHRQMASSLGQQILDPIVGINIFRAARIKCDTENNNDTILAQRKFVYQAIVKVTPFSEEIDFIFTSVGQSIDVEELI